MAIRNVVALFLVSALLTGCTGNPVKDAKALFTKKPPAEQPVTTAGASTPVTTEPAAQVASASQAPAQATEQGGANTTLSLEELVKACSAWDKLSFDERKKLESAGGVHCWRRVGADPYQGSVEQALATSPWPKEVQNQLLDRVKRDEVGDASLVIGDRFDWMTFGKPGKGGSFRNHKNVVAAWGRWQKVDESYTIFGELHRAKQYGVTMGGAEYRLYQVADCNNWAGVAIPVQAPPVVAPPPPPGKVECSIGWGFTLYAWDNETLRPDIRDSVRQLSETQQCSTTAEHSLSPAEKYGGRLIDGGVPKSTRLVEVEIYNIDFDYKSVRSKGAPIYQGPLKDGAQSFPFRRDQIGEWVAAVVSAPDADILFPTAWTAGDGKRWLIWNTKECGFNAHIFLVPKGAGIRKCL